MGKYRLRIKVYSFANIDVEADNVEEAKSKIDDRPASAITYYDGSYREVMGVELLKK